MKHVFETLSLPSAPPATTFTVYHLIEQSSLPNLSIFCWGGPFQVPDLLNEIVLLVTELLILCSVSLEVAQELHKFGLVLQQYVQHWLSLVGVCNEYLLQKGYRHYQNWQIKAFYPKIRSQLKTELPFTIPPVIFQNNYRENFFQKDMSHFMLNKYYKHFFFSSTPWRHGTLQTGCFGCCLLACSSSASSSLPDWCILSWQWSCVYPREVPQGAEKLYRLK